MIVTDVANLTSCFIYKNCYDIMCDASEIDEAVIFKPTAIVASKCGKKLLRCIARMKSCSSFMVIIEWREREGDLCSRMYTHACTHSIARAIQHACVCVCVCDVAPA